MRNPGTKVFLLAATATLIAGCQQQDNKANPANVAAAGNASAGAEIPSTTIAQTIGQNADLSTFASAIKAAGLEATMGGAQPYTVFAPSNAAFQKLPAGAAEGLMQPASKGKLTGILTYHIVPGVVTAKDLSAAIEKGKGKAELATVGGVNLTATESGGVVTITDAKGGKAQVTKADLLQSNGVVHVVDSVLMPS